ncbi:expressed protein, partial [Chlorella variabilis]
MTGENRGTYHAGARRSSVAILLILTLLAAGAQGCTVIAQLLHSYCTVIAQLLHRMLDTVVSFTLSEALAVAAAVGLFLGLFSAAALLVLLRWVEKRLVEARPGGDSRPPRHAEPSVRHVPLEGSLQPARDPAPPTDAFAAGCTPSTACQSAACGCSGCGSRGMGGWRLRRRCPPPWLLLCW